MIERAPPPPCARRRLDAALACVLGLAALAPRVALLGKESLWSDEFDTWAVATSPTVAELMRHVVTIEPHPPLYFLLTRAFLRLIGDSGDAALRLPSALAGALTIPLFFYFLRFLYPCRRSVALVGAALLALSPMHLWYSQEARAYAVQLLFETAALAALAWGLARSGEGNGPPRRAALGLGGAALFVTLAFQVQYYSAFIWMAFFGWILWVGPGLRRLAPHASLPALALLALGALQPAWSVLQRLLSGWTQSFNAFLPAHYGPDLLYHVARAQLLGPMWSPLPRGLQFAALAAGLCLALAGAWALWRRRDPLPALLILCGLVFTLALPVAISFVKPIIFWGQRYLIIALPFTLTLVALGITLPRWRWRAIPWGLCALLVACQGIYLANYFAHHVKHRWDAVGTLLGQKATAGQTVFVVPDRAAPLLARYTPSGPRIVGLAAGAPLSRVRESAGAPFFLISYVDPRPWLAAAGVGGPFDTRVFEPYRPGQELWVVEAGRDKK